jgi:hypothetical protein
VGYTLCIAESSISLDRLRAALQVVGDLLGPRIGHWPQAKDFNSSLYNINCIEYTQHLLLHQTLGGWHPQIELPLFASHFVILSSWRPGRLHLTFDIAPRTPRCAIGGGGNRP